MTETLFGSSKVERLHGMRFATCRQAKGEVTDWPRFYKISNPMAFEKMWLVDKERLAA